MKPLWKVMQIVRYTWGFVFFLCLSVSLSLCVSVSLSVSGCVSLSLCVVCCGARLWLLWWWCWRGEEEGERLIESLRRAGVEQLYQVKRMIGGIGDVLFSIFSQTWIWERSKGFFCEPLGHLINHTWANFGKQNWRWPPSLLPASRV